MAKTKLDKAIERQVESLNDAQREIVNAQYAVYKQNKKRIYEIEDILKTSGRTPSVERSSLTTERNQLTIANNEIAAKLFEQLKG